MSFIYVTIFLMDEPTSNSISTSHSKGEEREQFVKKLEETYQGQYGEYKYYAGQVLVFKQDNVANKVLLIKPFESKDHDNRPYLKFRARPVYEGDNLKELSETIVDFKEESRWYEETFENVEGLEIPKEEYHICEDPMNTGNNTVLISMPWLNGIEGDIFRMDPNQLYEYIKKYPDFKKTLVMLVEKFLELAEEDIYPDYLGVDNVAIYKENDVPKIALIDTHIVWIGKCCREDVKGRLDKAISRMKKFVENPEETENVKQLASGGLGDSTG